jgi:flagellar basal-body rod protein FlgB
MDADMIANDVFGVAARQASWLLARQRVVAQNVANANTPGYKAADLKPFDTALQQASLELTATSPKHFTQAAENAPAAPAAENADSADVYYSGNDVSEEAEMAKGNEIYRAYSLNTSIVSAFNNMILQSVKG